MSTDAMLYPHRRLKLGVDGMRPTGTVASDGCCADPLCIPLCDSICSFLDVLPDGPMWDRNKQIARQVLTQGGSITGCDTLCVVEPDCPSMISYAAYAGHVLHDMLSNILWPSIREASPYTSVTTLDDWIARLGWEDCYRQNCNTTYRGLLSPYEFLGECGPTYCEPSFSKDVECALKYAIVVSLTRARRGFIKNLDGFNWVIEPLGSVLRPRQPYSSNVLQFLRGECDETEVAPCFCENVLLEICNTSDTLPGCPDLQSQCGKTTTTVAAQQSYSCPGRPTIQLYPGVIAAECIVRSFMPRKCPNILYICGEPLPVDA